MATPTSFSVPDLKPHDIITALDREAQRQREATPPSTFATLALAQPYDYLCEIEHSKYHPRKVNKMRMSIRDDRYWELEALFWCEEYSKRIWEQSLERHRRNAASKADAMRAMACEYMRRLNRIGTNVTQIQEKRHSIEDQAYWKPEAEYFRAVSAAGETALIDEFAKRRTWRRNRAEPTRVQERRRSAGIRKRPATADKENTGRQLRRRPQRSSCS